MMHADFFFIFSDFFVLMCMNILLICMSVYHKIPGNLGNEKRLLNPLQM